ncbi:hypothetical protein AN415_01120 [Acinetobacter baumannii]|nr:hypothetical protein AN415_01120 [Acinetobacter baumannii]
MKGKEPKNLTVHGGIRHLENGLKTAETRAAVHGGIRHLENE